MARADKVQKPSTQRIDYRAVFKAQEKMNDWAQELHRTDEELNRESDDFLSPTEELHRVKVVSLIDARIKVTGKYSGQEYLFPQAGAVVDVDQTDVEWLLAKRQGGRQCCGGTEIGNKVFQLAEE